MSARFSISIVSHGHRVFIARLLLQLAALERADFDVVLTLNLPEAPPVALESLPFHVHLIQNAQPRGFAANHNTAFVLGQGDYFVILNPDIRLLDDPFPALLALLEGDAHCICAPRIINDAGQIEDSARNFPSPYQLSKRLACRILGLRIAADQVPQTAQLLMPDWVAGMFLMVPRAVYQALGGFNDGYFLYFEDVDFAARARLLGYRIKVHKATRVVHEAQRDSHRKLRYMRWHLQSAAKFFISSTYMRIQIKRINRK